MDIKKLKALSFLGWHFFTHFLKKLGKSKAPGLTTFLNNYRADRIFAIDPDTRAQMPDFSRCYTCRLCDTACPQIATSSQLMAPSYLVSTFSRSLPDYAYFNGKTFDCGTCQACDEICPQNVPIRNIAAFVHKQAQSFQNAA